MATEVEVKILDVDPAEVSRRLDALGAEKISEERLTVDWFRPADVDNDDVSRWFLRVRKSSRGTVEITWKSKTGKADGARVHEEINLAVDDADRARDFFHALGFPDAGHQEKDRVTWTLQEWTFCLDTYPDMPPWLEIEGRDGAHIREAVALLGLEGHESLVEGERVAISTKYGLDWYDMRF